MIRAAMLLLAVAAVPALAQQAYDPSLDPVRYDGCVRAIDADAAKVVTYATEWQALGGGLPARHCLALAQLHLGQNAAAEQTLVEAAALADREKSPMAADLWGQAGNAALLAGDVAGAVGHFSAAILSAGEFAPKRTANLLIDRARARVEQQQPAAARADLDRALGLDADAAEGWLLSAALARRQQDLPRARADIAKALTLAPADGDVLLGAARIAEAGKDPKAAREFLEKAAAGQDADAAETARQALAASGSPQAPQH